jgi:hypothetical protein
MPMQLGARPRIATLISRDRTACLVTAQREKVRREGESENEGQQDQSETFEHVFLLTGAQASKMSL